MTKTEKRYFTVTTSCKIGGGQYVPGVCYFLTELITASVEQLASEGKASIYNEEVRMVSGRAVPVARSSKIAASEQAVKGDGNDVSAVSSASATETASQSTQTVVHKATSQSKKRAKKSGIRF